MWRLIKIVRLAPAIVSTVFLGTCGHVKQPICPELPTTTNSNPAPDESTDPGHDFSPTWPASFLKVLLNIDGDYLVISLINTFPFYAGPEIPVDGLLSVGQAPGHCTSLSLEIVDLKGQQFPAQYKVKCGRSRAEGYSKIPSQRGLIGTYPVAFMAEDYGLSKGATYRIRAVYQSPYDRLEGNPISQGPVVSEWVELHLDEDTPDRAEWERVMAERLRKQQSNVNDGSVGEE